jgi:ABC-2 type transport system ATP-binding protein
MTTATGRPSRRRRSGPASDSQASTSPIRTRSLTKRYGDRVAVDRLDLEVRAGEIFGLLGQNGAGKTTTILMLLGLTEPSGGGARVVGLDPSRHPLEVKRRVGYLPDSVGFYGNMTGRENLRYTARLNGLTGADAEDHINVALEQVGLTDRGETRTDTYSRGMLQRLGIADALIKDPDVLILDEPTASIDPIGVIEILELLRTLAHERGITVLLSSHLLDQVQSVCDRVGIFAHGQLVGVGTVPELAERFGFAVSDIEIVIDEPADRHPAIAAALNSVDGVTEARLTVPMADDGSVPTAVNRAWIVTVQPDRELSAVIGAIVAKLADFRLVRIGRHDPGLEQIYRTAVAGMGRGFAIEEEPA